MSKQINERRIVTCQCGTIFTTTDPAKRTCSKQCHAFRGRRKLFACRLCTEPFIAYAYRIGRVKYCSRRCQYNAADMLHEPAVPIEDAPTPVAQPRALKQCSVCDTLFVGNRRQRCCSPRCAGILRSQAFAGKANPHYRHGQCVDGQITKEYKRWNNRQHRFRRLDVLLKRQRYRCVYCRKRITINSAEIDHIKPIARGGLDVATNRQATCKTCNRRKLDKLPEVFAREMGFLL